MAPAGGLVGDLVGWVRCFSVGLWEFCALLVGSGLLVVII